MKSLFRFSWEAVIPCDVSCVCIRGLHMSIWQAFRVPGAAVGIAQESCPHGRSSTLRQLGFYAHPTDGEVGAWRFGNLPEDTPLGRDRARLYTQSPPSKPPCYLGYVSRASERVSFLTPVSFECTFPGRLLLTWVTVKHRSQNVLCSAFFAVKRCLLKRISLIAAMEGVLL